MPRPLELVTCSKSRATASSGGIFSSFQAHVPLPSESSRTMEELQTVNIVSFRGPLGAPFLSWHEARPLMFMLLTRNGLRDPDVHFGPATYGVYYPLGSLFKTSDSLHKPKRNEVNIRLVPSKDTTLVQNEDHCYHQSIGHYSQRSERARGLRMEPM
jgi:hypothetical protein